MTKAQWRRETSILSIFNRVKVVNGKTLACVGWHGKQWKVVPEGSDFDTIADRQYQPIAEFRTRDELMAHVFTQ